MKKLQENMKEMLRTIEAEYRYTGGLTGRYHLPENIYEAIAAVPRERFVPEPLRPFAYDNNPLPIGNGQTISQPYIVALMTDLLEPEADNIVLEVGTGSGYQAAILAQLVKKVYSLEIIPELAGQATDTLARLGMDNIKVVSSDGSLGLAEHAPYDGIIVTAAAPRVPEALVNQLKPGGRLVIPIGRPHMPQELILIRKKNDGRIETTTVLSVSFVPFTGRVSNNGPDRDF